MRTEIVCLASLALGCGGLPFTTGDRWGDDGGPDVAQLDPMPEAAAEASDPPMDGGLDAPRLDVAAQDAADGDAHEAATDAPADATPDVILAQPPPPCGPATCASGCCGVGTFYGMCFEGIQPQACGVGGGACLGMGTPPCWTCTNHVCEARPDGG